MTVRVQTEDFDLQAEVALLRADNPHTGAVVAFIGTVRDMNEDTNVVAMELEHYPGMTEKALQDIVSCARQRWKIIEARVIHRVGALLPRDHIVLVAVAASHRGEAFRACEYIIDCLKTDAPFWKKEQTPKGTRWVDARVNDEAVRKRWNKSVKPERGT